METNEKMPEAGQQPESGNDKKYNLYKMMTIILSGVCVFILAVGAAVGGYFYKLYANELGTKAVEAARFEESLDAAEKIIADLEEKNAELEAAANTNVLYLADADGSTYQVEEIPFFVNPDDWRYILVNEVNPLEEEFTVELARFSVGQYVDKRIKESLDAMFAAAKKEGLKLMVCSSYREIKKQQQLMDSAVKRYMRRGMTYTEAFYEAKEQIALTGTSEHHTGLALDIVGVNHQSLDAAQAKTAEAIWLSEHAAEYGFILRFPADKEEITGISFESWHYRYVGEEAAAYMKEKNLCLEEFVELAQLQLGMKAKDRININMRKDAD